MAKIDILEDGHGALIEDEDGKLIQVSEDNASIYFVDAFIDPQSVLTGGKYLISAKLEDKKTLLEDGDGNIIEDGDGALIEIPKLLAVAIYSADDDSLTFYGVTEIPEVGSMYEGKTVTNVYTDVDTWQGGFSSVPWSGIRSRVVSVSFDRSFESIQPICLSCWFSRFENCEKIDLRYLDTSQATEMDGMFDSCSKLTDLDLSRFDTSNVTIMDSMFYECTGITTLDISGFKTQKLTSMTSMFFNASNLKTIYSDDDNFTIENVDYRAGYYVFEGCYSIVGGAGTTYDETATSYRMAHVDTPMEYGYFTAKQ